MNGNDRSETYLEGLFEAVLGEGVALERHGRVQDHPVQEPIDLGTALTVVTSQAETNKRVGAVVAIDKALQRSIAAVATTAADDSRLGQNARLSLWDCSQASVGQLLKLATRSDEVGADARKLLQRLRTQLED